MRTAYVITQIHQVPRRLEILYHGREGESWTALYNVAKILSGTILIYSVAQMAWSSETRLALAAYDGPSGEPLPIIREPKRWLKQQHAVTERVKRFIQCQEAKNEPTKHT